MGQIPTDDAEAALRFCQALARQVDNDVTASAGRQSSALTAFHPGASAQRHRSRVVGCHTRLQGRENISVVHDRLVVAPEGANLDFEILFVDDGSNDETGQKLSDLEASDDRVRMVALARNFGHQVHCRSRFRRAVAVMDADLQDPSEMLPEFIAKWREGNEVVYDP
jgi:dolichol-phosphate mannosyltransferase